MSRIKFSKARPCWIMYDYGSVPDRRFGVGTDISVGFEYEVNGTPVINDDPIVLAGERWNNSKERKALIRYWGRIISDLKKGANIYKKEGHIFKQIKG